MSDSPNRPLKRTWISQDIQTKILVPLTLLMLLSLIGSLISFFVATNATRNRISDSQIESDFNRLAAALAEGEREVTDSARVLARASGITDALIDRNVLPLNRQSLLVRERFRLDQVLIVDTNDQTLINIASQSMLTRLDPEERERLLGPVGQRDTRLIPVGEAWLIIGNAPVFLASSGSNTRLADIYTVLNVTESIERYRRELGLISEAQILPNMTSLTDPTSQEGFRELSFTVNVAGGQLPILLRRSEREINTVLGSGIGVVLVVNSITIGLLLAIGIWLARSFTKPIQKLSRVAEAVAAGDLSARANLFGNDEIGRLGNAIDQANTTIGSLLERQARSAGELRAIMESIADGVLAVDALETIIILNPTAAQLLHRQPEDLLGQPLDALTAVDDEVLATAMQQIVDQMRDELADPLARPTEENVAIEGRIVRLNSAPISAAGQRLGAVVVLQDITAAIEADRAKTEFIATASHELRTPLASIKGYVDIFQLLGTHNLTEEQRSYLAVIRRQSDNMAQLISDLLEMARIERGALRASKRWLNPVEA